jgi:hypothetical protein
LRTCRRKLSATECLEAIAKLPSIDVDRFTRHRNHVRGRLG